MTRQSDGHRFQIDAADLSTFPHHIRCYEYGAKDIHMRPACPPLLYGCKFLNFSRSKSEMDLAARKAIAELEDDNDPRLEQYREPDSDKHQAMVDRIGKALGLTSLKYQRLPSLVEAIGLPKCKLCTYCWDGEDGSSQTLFSEVEDADKTDP